MLKSSSCAVLAGIVLWSGRAAAQDTTFDDSMTMYLPSSPSTGQNLAPRVEQRGVFFDGTTRARNVQGWITARQQTGEPWNGNAFLSGGLQLHTGTWTTTDVHLALPAQVPWIVGVSYNGRQDDGGAHDSDGPQGMNWQQLSQPEIIVVDQAGDEDDMVYILYGADRFLEFRRVMDETPDPDEPTDTFKGVNRGAGAVVYTAGAGGEPDTWTYYDPSGRETTFFGGNTASNKADWQIWKIKDAAGNVAFVGDATTASTAVSNGYTAEGYIEYAYDSADRRFTYTYSTVAGSKVLTQVKAETKSSGTWASPSGVAEVGKVEYAYYVNADTYGSDRDLKTITITTPLTDSGISDVRVKYFRYWESTHNPGVYDGHPHLIQYIVDYEGTRSFDWLDSTFDADYVAASENSLKPYASAYFEYDSSRRIEAAWFNGECGCSGASNGLYSFTYDTNGSYTDNAGYDTTWATRTKVGRPDGAYITQYFDETGGPLSRVTTDGDPAASYTDWWATVVTRTTHGVSAIATPANVTTYTHSTGAFAQSTSVGLIQSFDRGEAGNVIWREERQGTSGTLYRTSGVEYFSKTRSVGDANYSVQRWFVQNTREYANAWTVGSEPGASIASTSAVSANNSIQLIPRTTTSTRVAVPTGENGSNSSEITSKRYTRQDGTTAFVLRDDGTNEVYDYMQYTNGQLVKSIRDAQTNHGSDFASGDDPNGDFSITESGTGTRLITTYAYDPQGRSSTTTSPSGRVTRQYYTRLADRRLLTISIPRVVAGSPDTFYGPCSFSVTNHAGQVEASGMLALTGNDDTTALTGWIDETQSELIAAVDVGAVTHLSTSIYNESGTELAESRSYFLVPGSLPGSDGTNYDATAFGYDSMGRRWRSKDATGTITRTVFDDLGRTIERWVGKNDNNFSGGEGSGPDTMVKVEAIEYDGGTDQGNGHVTKRTSYVEGSTTGQRVTEYLHDLRGRTVVTINPQAPHSLVKYDNRNRIVAAATYSSSSGLDAADDAESLDTNRLSLSKSHYDARGRVWKSENFKINQSTGAIVQESSQNVSLVTLTWYDDADRVIKSVGSSISKTIYDRLGRVARSYVLAKINDSTYADADDVTGDHVLEESHSVYQDSTGLVLATGSIQRFHDDTSTTGALDTNADADDLAWTAANITGRLSVTAMWYDDLDRLTDTVQYGTYGGSTFDRDGLSVPSRSDTALRSTNTYYDSGELKEVEDPKGLKTRYEYDAAGRQTKVINNYADGTPGGGTGDEDDQVITYAYTDGLQISMTADLPSGQDDQTTTYTYGVTKGVSAGDSKISHGGLLQKVTYPDSGGGTDVVTFAYDAQGAQIWTKDQSGNIIETDYDTAGRQTHRRITTLDADFDGAVRRISTTYTSRGQVQAVISYDNATVGSGSTLNGVKYTYDEWGNLTLFEQDNDSEVGGSGSTDLETEYTYALAHDVTGQKGYRQLRRTATELPNGDDVGYDYLSTGSRLDDDAGRVTRVTHSAVVVASYDYLGSGQVVKTYLDEAEVYSSVTGASGHGYADLDRFGRLIASSWTWDEATDVNLYRTVVSYDRNSWITRVEDTTWTRQSVDYTNDELGRLTLANRGLLSGGSITVNNFNHEWTLGQTGNWNRSKLDLNGDADLTDTDELDENNPLASGGSAHFNAANELTARDTDNNGSDNYSLAYDEVGNMTDDGKEYEYVYDPFGRLRKIKNTSNQALVAEYWYNGLGHRIIWHSDTSRSGGGAPDGTVDTNDPKVHFIYNERWQQVATYRQANGSNIDTYPKEQFVYHGAGFAGYGGSSYIDGVILRDDHEDDWTEAADSTMERRIYYCQNWRADVVALLAENGRIVERAWYEPYGTPHGMSPADFSGTSDDTNDHYLVPDGDADADDSFVYLDLFGLSAGLSDTTGSSDPGDPEYGRPNGTVDSDDYFYYLDQYSVAASLGRNVLSAGHDGATASHGAGNLRNRKGLAGYEWDPHVRRYHVRTRVLYPQIGRWTRRDPLGYVDGVGLYEYVATAPMVASDPLGLAVCAGSTCNPYLPQPMPFIDPMDDPPVRTPPTPVATPPNPVLPVVPVIPGCPPFAPAPAYGDGWCEDALGGGHCGLKCYRSYGNGTQGGQQCCYNEDGSLNTQPDCMGTVDLFGECACGEIFDGSCDFLCPGSLLCTARHNDMDVEPYRRCSRKYNELHCCLRSINTPSGTPGSGVTDLQLWGAYDYCRREVYINGSTFCQPPSSVGCNDDDYVPPKAPRQILPR